MAKHILFDYTFDPQAKTITLDDTYDQKRFLVITNVTSNVIIYNFADPSFGATFEYKYDPVQTVITLNYDTTSMAAGDSLQIFYDADKQSFAPADEYLDPVSKIRVSNPENLIDTDFEYGLQSTKWETLETTANIPTFFSRNGDRDITLTSVTVSQGSNIVEVTTELDHGLLRGSPIFMQGTTNILCDGGFIVKTVVSDKVFRYQAKGNLTFTGTVRDTYTQLFSAAIYDGTEFKLSNTEAITSDGAVESTLTVATEYPTRFQPGTQVSLTNSYAKATVQFDTEDVVTTNRTTVTKSVDETANQANSEYNRYGIGPWDSLGGFRYGAIADSSLDCYLKENLHFDPDEIVVDTVNNTITFPFDIPYNSYCGYSTSLYENLGYQQPLGFVYFVGRGNTPIGGMQDGYAYWMWKIADNKCYIQKQKSTSSTYRVNLTSAGSSGGHTKDTFVWGLSVVASYDASTDYFEVYRDTYIFGANGGIGYSTTSLSNYVNVYKNPDYLTPYDGGWADYNRVLEYTYNNVLSDNWTGFPTSSRYFGPYFTYYSPNYGYLRYRYRRNWYSSSYYQLSFSISGNNYNDYVIVPKAARDMRGNVLYVPNHGFETHDQVSVSVTNGSLGATFDADTGVVRLDDNHVSLAERVGFTGGLYINTSPTLTNGQLDVSLTNTKQKKATEIDRLVIPGDNLAEGDKVIYYNDVAKDNSGTDIGGLSDASTYYIVNKSSDGTSNIAATDGNFRGDEYTFGNMHSISYVNIVNDTLVNIQFQFFNTGDAVEYRPYNYVSTGNRYTVPGLNSEGVYWIRKVTSTEISLHPTYADAIANTNKVDINGYSTTSSNHSFVKLNLIDLTSTPSTNETQVFEADFVGAADGNYSISSSSADQLNFQMENGAQVTPRSLTVVGQDVFVADEDGFFITGHGFITGQEVVVTITGTVNVSGITSGSTYYAIAKNENFLQLASTVAEAEAGTAISLTEMGSLTAFTSGEITFEPGDIVGRFAGAGNVSGSVGSNLIVGSGTRFLSFFQKGDKIYFSKGEVTTSLDVTSVAGTVATTSDTVTTDMTGKAVKWDAVTGGEMTFIRYVSGTTFTLHRTKTDADANTNAIDLTGFSLVSDAIVYTDFGDFLEHEIANVNDDTDIVLTENLTSNLSEASYMLQTKVIMRPDGFALHRPYDGGVELIAPVNPNSAMVRQTRKYFRYQSGKGIQVSYAVNFSPSTDIDTYTASGTTATLTTRYPHRLRLGSKLEISGSTNTKDAIGTTIYDVTVQQDTNGNNRYYYDNTLEDLTFYEGRTYRLSANSSTVTGHPIVFIQRSDDTEYETGVKYYLGGSEVSRAAYVSGFDAASDRYVEITVATDAPELKTHCTNHNEMGVIVLTPTDPDNGVVNLWNGSHTVASIVDPRTFTITLDGTPSDLNCFGSPQFYVSQWDDCALRCGLFDDQNGLFFEYDGNDLYCVVRDSTSQLRGTVTCTFRSGEITGRNTSFLSQVNVGDYLVIKGQSYKVTKISNNETLFIAPSYRGATRSNVIVSKTRENRAKQSDWNIDKADGKGKSGFKLDLGKIQMAYIDYSWYGAGKVRFGFKDQNGNVKYCHSFAHGNYKKEAYMRSGNMPARYELHNGDNPTYTPALAHWGTSVIMDGRFDPDKAYLFNAASKSIVTTGQDQVTLNARVETTAKYIEAYWYGEVATLGHALLLQAPDSQYASFPAGEVIQGAGLSATAALANPEDPYYASPYIQQVNTIIEGEKNNQGTRKRRTLLFLNEQPSATSGVNSSYTVGTSGADVGITGEIPLISIRLAPSVDTSAPGFLGEREIINRMQLILNQVGILSTHAVSVKLVLNAKLNTTDWLRVDNPSLSQLIYHKGGDTVNGGQAVFNFEASGGTGTSNRAANLTTIDLGEIATLGNSILGGDNTFPDGPDVLTVVAEINEDIASVSGTNPFVVSARVSWSESQA